MLNGKYITTLSIAVGVSVAVSGTSASAQQPAGTAPAPVSGPVVNDLAPDFSLAGADRYGLLRTPVKLSDYRGRTVVLAFFFKARTKG
jgi:peroxiredoxin Q/BCP